MEKLRLALLDLFLVRRCDVKLPMAPPLLLALSPGRAPVFTPSGTTKPGAAALPGLGAGAWSGAQAGRFRSKDELCSASTKLPAANKTH